MAQLVHIQQCRAEYSENILPITALISDTSDISFTGDGTVTVSNDYQFSDNKSLKLEMPISPTITRSTNFNLGSDLEYTAKYTGNYIFSFRMLNVTNASNPTGLELKVNLFVNSLLIDSFLIIKDQNLYENEKFYTFSQSFNLTSYDVVNFTFETVIGAVTPNPILKLHFSGFKLELDDRFLGIPSIYSKPKSEQITGYQSRVDTSNTQNLTALTENLISFSGTLEENGGLTLMDANAKVTPISLNDIISVDFTFTSINPAGTDQYINCNFVVDGVVYRSQTFPLVKGSGFEDNCSVSFVFPVTATFLTNGGEFYLYPSSETTIKNRYLAVTRIGKGI